MLLQQLCIALSDFREIVPPFSFAYSCRINKLRVREIREELQMALTQPPTMPQTTPTKGTDQITLGADPTTQDGE